MRRTYSMDVGSAHSGRKIVVAAPLANKPRNGGQAALLLSYLLGFRRLGCDVAFVEQIAPGRCSRAALDHFRAVVGGAGLSESSWLVTDGGEIVLGPGRDRLLASAAAADLLVNGSGNLTSDALFPRFRSRLYLDEDPGYTQLWLAAGSDVGRLEEHDLHFTVGLNVGSDRCSLPTGNIRWHPLLPSVVLDVWPALPAPAGDRFTSVGSWRSSYGRVEHDGVLHGQKAHEFRKLLELPRRVRATLELALEIAPADEDDRRLLLDNGWQLVDPAAVAPTSAAYRAYVQRSRAEFSAAQGVYVETRSGWFSERTARYLASARPAVVQDTGFGDALPVGKGLLSFRTIDEAVAAIDDVQSDYEAHARAARELAERYLDSDRVLASLLGEALSG